MEQELILYNSADGKSSVSLLARDGSVWLNQMQLAELFATSVPNISQHINNILKESELDSNSTIKYFLTVATNGKPYQVKFYSLEMILAVGFRDLSAACSSANGQTAILPNTCVKGL